MNSNSRFDLSKLDFDKNRLAKRKKLFLLSLPIAGPVSILVIVLLVFGLSILVSSSMFNSSSFDSAKLWLKPAETLSFVDQTLVYYNRGNIEHKMSDFEQSEVSYIKALGTTDKFRECSIRINLVSSLEAQSDKLVNEREFDKAIVILDKAKSVISDGAISCGLSLAELEEIELNNSNKASEIGKNTEEQNPSEIAKQQYSRIDSKLKQAKKSKNAGQISKEQDSQAEQKSNEASEPSEEALNDLREKSLSAQKNRSESQRKRDYRKLTKEDFSSGRKVW